MHMRSSSGPINVQVLENFSPPNTSSITSGTTSGLTFLSYPGSSGLDPANSSTITSSGNKNCQTSSPGVTLTLEDLMLSVMKTSAVTSSEESGGDCHNTVTVASSMMAKSDAGSGSDSLQTSAGLSSLCEVVELSGPGDGDSVSESVMAGLKALLEAIEEKGSEAGDNASPMDSQLEEASAGELYIVVSLSMPYHGFGLKDTFGSNLGCMFPICYRSHSSCVPFNFAKSRVICKQHKFEKQFVYYFAFT